MSKMVKYSWFLVFVFTIQSLSYDKLNIAIMDLQGQSVSEPDAISLTNRIRAELYNSGLFTIVERETIEDVLAEQGLQQSGCTSSECIVELGRLLNVQRMVAGSVDKLGNLYTIHLRMIDVQSGEVLILTSVDSDGTIEEVALKSTGEVVDNLIDGMNAGRPNPISAKQRPQRKAGIKNAYMSDLGMTIPKNQLFAYSEFDWQKLDQYYHWDSGEFTDFAVEDIKTKYNTKLMAGYGISDRLELSILLNYLGISSDNYNFHGIGFTLIQSRFSVLTWDHHHHGMVFGVGYRSDNEQDRQDLLFSFQYSSPWYSIFKFNAGFNFFNNGTNKWDIEVGNEAIIDLSCDICINNKMFYKSVISSFYRDQASDINGEINDSEVNRLFYQGCIVYAVADNLFIEPGVRLMLYGKGGQKSDFLFLFGCIYLF